MRGPDETMASNTQKARTWTAAGAGASCAPAGGSLPRPARGRLFLGRIGGFAATLIIGCAVLFAYPRGIAEANEALAKTPEATYSEYRIKAAFIYIFAKFTRWPARAYADPDAPLRVCVLGQDSFGRELDAIAGKRVGDRHVAVENLARLADVDRCQMLFVGESKRHDLPAVVAYLGDRSILTVADKPGFARANGMIGMRTVAGKVRFRINLGAARHAGLRFSTRLLDLAEACIARPYLGKAGKKRIFLLCSRRRYGLSASAGS